MKRQNCNGATLNTIELFFVSKLPIAFDISTPATYTFPIT